MRRSFVRGKVRRLRARLAAALPGRHGVPPPVTTNRCEELADEEVSASRKRGPCRETAELERRKAFAAERRLEDRCARRRSGPLVSETRAVMREYPDAQIARARKR